MAPFWELHGFPGDFVKNPTLRFNLTVQQTNNVLFILWGHPLYHTCFCIILQNSSSRISLPGMFPVAARVLSATDNSCFSSSSPVLSVAHKMPVSCMLCQQRGTNSEFRKNLFEVQREEKSSQHCTTVTLLDVMKLGFHFRQGETYFTSQKCIMVKTLEQTPDIPWFGIASNIKTSDLILNIFRPLLKTKPRQ